MRRKIQSILIMLAVISLAASCKKAGNPGSDDVMPEGTPLRVKVSLDPSTRTTLDSDGLTLLWEEGDQIALFSTFVGSMDDYDTKRFSSIWQGLLDQNEAVNEEDREFWLNLGWWLEGGKWAGGYTHGGVCTIESASAGQNTGTFVSRENARNWFPKEDSTDDEKYWFCAYYPARGDVNDMQYVSSDDFGGIYRPYTMVYIPTWQDGRSWNRYQLVASAGYNEIDGRTEGLLSRQDVLENNITPSFSSFVPLTTLLSFDIVSGDGATYDIRRIEITQEVSYKGTMRSDLYAMSGWVGYFPFNDEPEGDGDITLWNRPCWPSSIGNNYGISLDDSDYSWWSQQGWPNYSINIDFADPVTVTSTPGETFYAVTVPTRACPDDLNPNQNPVLVFRAYDDNGNPILTSRLVTPDHINTKTGEVEHDGLRPGRRYDFHLTLRNPSYYDKVYGGAENAGQYDVITDW